MTIPKSGSVLRNVNRLKEFATPDKSGIAEIEDRFMNALEISKKIKLKSQDIKLISEERARLRYLLNLIRLRGYFEGQIRDKFDPELSQQLDAVLFLIETMGGLPQGLSGGALTTSDAPSVSGRGKQIEGKDSESF
jgi:hypothetical protein